MKMFVWIVMHFHVGRCFILADMWLHAYMCICKKFCIGNAFVSANEHVREVSPCICVAFVVSIAFVGQWRCNCKFACKRMCLRQCAWGSTCARICIRTCTSRCFIFYVCVLLNMYTHLQMFIGVCGCHCMYVNVNESGLDNAHVYVR